jgi:transcriptional regulator with XRE-family HTH domain
LQGKATSDMAHISIGENIRTLRKMRSFTVRQLAAKATISASSLEKYESGDRNPTPAVITALASALSVGPEVLNGQPYYNSTEADEGIQAVIPDLRRVLATYDSPDALTIAPRPIEVLAAETERVSLMRQNASYVRMGHVLPGLLAELSHTALESGGEDQQQAFWWLARGYRAANSLAHKLGHHDLSNTALERFRWAADRSADPHMQVTAAYLRAGMLVRLGAFDSARRILQGLVGEIDRLAPEGSLTEVLLALRGAVLLKLAIVEARDGGGDRVDGLLGEAQLLADMGGGRDTDFYEMSFGPTNVRIHRFAAMTEEGDAEQALARLEEWGAEQRVSEWVLPISIAAERSSHHHIDVAAARLTQADRRGAFGSLKEARVLAPVHTRFHPSVRHTAEALVRADRTDDAELAAFARWVGVAS